MAGHDPSIADESFDRYARMVRRSLGVPVALVSIVEANRQVFPGAVGLPEPYQVCRETPLTHSFCQYVVAEQKPLVVTDARSHPVLATNLAIPDLGVVAYAGWPLTDHSGKVIGSLCAIDGIPRDWDQDELDALADLAAACSAEIAQRELRREATSGRAEARRRHDQASALLALSESMSATATLDDIPVAIDRVAVTQLGCLRAGLWLREDDAYGSERLRLLATTAMDRPAIEAHTVVAIDRQGPLGACCLDHQPRIYGFGLDQLVEFPTFRITGAFGRARAVLPLVVDGQATGALVLGWAEERGFSGDDEAVLGAFATYTAQAVQRAQLLQERTNTSSTLQRAMLAPLPKAPGLTLAASYRPASTREQVGGDWYDALVFPDGSTGLVCGDVVGHDIPAAAEMGQMRSLLRAFAWAEPDSPARAVTQLDEAIPALGLDTLATLAFVRARPTPECHRWDVVWTNAGHPPPVLVDMTGQVTRLVGESSDVLVGVDTGLARHDSVAKINTGATLVLYTDGLIERRGEEIDRGLERLTQSLRRHYHLPLPELLDAILEDQLDAVLRDDVAVLAVRFNGRDD